MLSSPLGYLSRFLRWIRQNSGAGRTENGCSSGRWDSVTSVIGMGMMHHLVCAAYCALHKDVHRHQIGNSLAILNRADRGKVWSNILPHNFQEDTWLIVKHIHYWLIWSAAHSVFIDLSIRTLGSLDCKLSVSTCGRKSKSAFKPCPLPFISHWFWTFALINSFTRSSLKLRAVVLSGLEYPASLLSSSYASGLILTVRFFGSKFQDFLELEKRSVKDRLSLTNRQLPSRIREQKMQCSSLQLSHGLQGFPPAHAPRIIIIPQQIKIRCPPWGWWRSLFLWREIDVRTKFPRSSSLSISVVSSSNPSHEAGSPSCWLPLRERWPAFLGCRRYRRSDRWRDSACSR